MLPKALFAAIIAAPLAAALAVPEGAAARDLPTSISRQHPTFTPSVPIPTGLPTGKGKGKGPHPSGTFSHRPHPTGSFTHKPHPTTSEIAARDLPTFTPSVPLPTGLPTGKGKGKGPHPSGTFSHKPHPTGVPSGIPSGFPTGKGKGKTHSAPPPPAKTPVN
ncbi:hypothetical protein B0T22DRAFT_523981 [Podospora appendiculata]|uniref:Uncharacterized protein n=1 Tax=Podospora appendiculata TaxID=314037 RepID=A0AAE1C781_9PEZI|nr:hypothetical protein B0T22DRAFT_523981 [Podospora appendiculata]